MAGQIKTEFDDVIENDVVFEETEQTMEYKDILKNTENMYKSFLYLRKMFSAAPVMNKLVKASTIEATSETAVVPDAETNMIMFKNLSDQNFEIIINGGSLFLLPFESFDFPLEGVETLSFIGHGSIVETKFVLR